MAIAFCSDVGRWGESTIKLPLKDQKTLQSDISVNQATKLKKIIFSAMLLKMSFRNAVYSGSLQCQDGYYNLVYMVNGNRYFSAMLLQNYGRIFQDLLKTNYS